MLGIIIETAPTTSATKVDSAKPLQVAEQKIYVWRKKLTPAISLVPICAFYSSIVLLSLMFVKLVAL